MAVGLVNHVLLGDIRPKGRDKLVPTIDLILATFITLTRIKYRAVLL